MNTATIYTANSTSSEQTEQLGVLLGKSLKGGEIIELVSDLGGGKTTFVRGLANGAGSRDVVASPTFTISKVYNCPKFQIYHFDFYRLDDPGLLAAELEESLSDPKIVTIIEWADVVSHVLPEDRLRVDIRQTPSGERTFKFSAPKHLDYLLKAVQ